MKPTMKILLILSLLSLTACRFKGSAADPAGEGPAPHAAEGHAEGAHAGAPDEDLAGVRVEPVGLRVMEEQLPASGILSVDPRRLVQVSARTQGRAEEVLAFEGDRVSAGQPLMRLSSTPFMAAQAEVLQAAQRSAGAGEPRDRELAAALMDAARQKLALMGMSDGELETLEREQRLFPLLTVRAPRAGTVLESEAVPGAAFDAGAPLFTIADLTVLQARADLYDEHLGRLKPGAGARVEVHAYPGRPFAGRLLAVADVMDEASRTVKVRIEVPNPGGLLKPGMFADITFTLPGGAPVPAVPEGALRTMDGRTVVFVLEEGRFVPREVRTGRKAGGWVEVAGGVGAGEPVAVEGSLGVKGEFMKGGLEGHGHD